MVLYISIPSLKQINPTFLDFFVSNEVPPCVLEKSRNSQATGFFLHFPTLLEIA
jgi:hypothetical protein